MKIAFITASIIVFSISTLAQTSIPLAPAVDYEYNCSINIEEVREPVPMWTLPTHASYNFVVNKDTLKDDMDLPRLGLEGSEMAWTYEDGKPEQLNNLSFMIEFNRNYTNDSLDLMIFTNLIVRQQIAGKEVMSVNRTQDKRSFDSRETPSIWSVLSLSSYANIADHPETRDSLVLDFKCIRTK